MKTFMRFILLAVNVGAFYFFYKTYGDIEIQSKVIILGVILIIILSKILSLSKYLIWSLTLISSLYLIVRDNELISNSYNCSNIGCSINGALLIAPFVLAGVTALLLIIQLIQFFAKRRKEKVSPIVSTKATNIFR